MYSTDKALDECKWTGC